MGDSARRDLRMIGLIAKQRVQKWLAGWLVASASRLHGDEHGVDLRQLLGIIKAHHPSPVGFVVHIKYTQIHWRSRLSLRRFALSPDLERARVHDSWLPVQIKRIENERFSLGIENTAKRFLCAAATVHIEHVGGVQLSGA